MTRFTITIDVEARDLSAAVGRFLYDASGEPVAGIISIEGEKSYHDEG